MKTTKTKKSAADADTMRPEYDFSNAVRGVTAARYAQGTNVVTIGVTSKRPEAPAQLQVAEDG